MRSRRMRNSCGPDAIVLVVVLVCAAAWPFAPRADDAREGQIKGEPVDTLALCEIQERLTHLGHYRASVDGSYGPATGAAIKKYEADQGLPQTGSATTKVLDLLRDSAKAARKAGETTGKNVQTPLPRSGSSFHDFRAGGQAPLQIATAGEGDHFFVKVQDVSNSASYKTMFIRGGDTVDTEVPLGTYSIKYAAGATWYGPQCLFGIETIFNKADHMFEFSRQGNQISGYRIELILQRNGNLSTSRIPRDQF